jgi:HK97 family phage portal protein
MATIYDNLKNLFSTKKTKEKKESPIVYYNSLGYDTSTKISYEDLATDGYQSNAIVNRCINEISNNASRVKINLFRGDQELENHPLLDLLYNPSPTCSQVEFFQSAYAYLLISGNNYMLSVSGDRTPPTELYNLRPDRIKIRTGSRAMPLSYDYVLNGNVVESYQVDQASGNAKVKHTKLFNPLNDYYGMSPISACSVDIDQHNLANKHNVNLLQNGARPSGAVIFKPKDETGGHVQLSDVQRDQLVNDINQRFSGTGNAGKPMLLEGDFDWKEMGLSPKDMDFIQLKNMSAKDIALVYGVPSQLIGIPDAQTYSNFSEAKLALYNETIIPLLDRFQSDLNEWLTPMFGDDLELRYDIDSIPAMAEQRRRVFESVTQGVQNGILTRNEAREQLGYETIDGADSLLVPANLMPLNIASEDSGDERSEEIPVEEEVDEEENNSPEIIVEDNSYGEIDEIIKAVSDIDTTPTDGMVSEAKKGIEWRKEFNRGGTRIGATRASQIVAKERLSPSTVKRMFSFFSRHEVDKEAQGFRPGEDGYPSNGRIAWALWGGDAGFSWSRKVAAQIDRERDKFYEDEIEEKQLTAAVKKGLQNKVDKHNEKHGDKKGKRVTLRMLGAVFRRGIGAYRTNPQSVRPSVRSEEQWAYARVNAFLYAVRTGRFRGGKFDLDLLPSGHPLKS